MQKLKAFTLLELLIGLLISSLVIAFCYTGYSVIYKQFLTYKSIKQEIIATAQFHTVLSNDFANAKTITFDNNVLQLKSPQQVSLFYEFNNKTVVRKYEQTNDTFNLIVNDIVPITMATEDPTSPPYIVSLSFNAQVLKESELFYYTKRYAADLLMEDVAD